MIKRMNNCSLDSLECGKKNWTWQADRPEYEYVGW